MAVLPRSVQDIINKIFDSTNSRLNANVKPLPVLKVDEAVNDSDKTLTVPSGKTWKIHWIWVELITTATVNNRQIEIEIQDDANDVILRLQAGAVQADSLTRNYLFASGLVDLTAFRDTSYLTTPLPDGFVLPSGYIVRVYDNNAVAADDMVIQMMVDEQ